MWPLAALLLIVTVRGVWAAGEFMVGGQPSWTALVGPALVLAAWIGELARLEREAARTS